MCVCVCALGSIGQLAGCGLQRWRWLRSSGGETAGVATIGSQVLSVTSTPPLPPASVPPFCLHSVRGRGGICYGERLTALMHISLNATLPAVTIRKEHMPGPGTTSEDLLRSQSHFFFCRLQYTLEVCIWSDCDGHFNRTEVWFCLADSNASQMDPITYLIVATSCLPFFLFFFSPQAAHCTLALQASWDNLISTAGPPFIFKHS